MQQPVTACPLTGTAHTLSWRLLSRACVLCLLLALSACGSNNKVLLPAVQPLQLPAALTTAAQFLPPPVALRRPSGIVVQIIDGAGFDPALQQHVATNAAAGQFTPNWSPGQGVGGLAYGLFVFAPDVAHVAPVLHLTWQPGNAPAAGQLWIGLADYPGQSWRFTAWTGGDVPLDLAGANINSNTGAVPVVLLLTGSSPATLARLRIGANQPPTAQLGLTKGPGPAPLDLTADATGSQDGDGLVVKYEFDLDGDGVYDQTRTVPTLNFNQGQNGAYHCQVRVTDDDGATAIALRPYDTSFDRRWGIVAGSQFNQGWDIAPIPAGGYYLAGFANQTAAGNPHGLLVRYGADGNPVWAKLLSSPSNQDAAFGVTLALDGGADVAYSMDLVGATPGTLCLAHFYPDGTLNWQRGIGVGQGQILPRVATDGVFGHIYLAGTLHSAINGDNLELVKFDDLGNWVWSREWGVVGDQKARGVALDAAGNIYVGFQAANGADADGGVLKFDGTGTVLAKTQYHTSGTTFNPIGINVQPDASKVALYGSLSTSSASGPMLLLLDSNLSQLYGAVSTQPNFSGESFYGSAFGPDGSLWLAGSYDTTNIYGVLLQLLPGGGIGKAFQADTGGPVTYLQGLARDSSGGFIFAGTSYNGGALSWTASARAYGPLTPTFSIPATSPVVDNTAPVVSTFSVANVQTAANAPDGLMSGVVFDPLAQ